MEFVLGWLLSSLVWLLVPLAAQLEPLWSYTP